MQPRDLTPVTWLEAPAHPPVEIVRDGQARAVGTPDAPKDWPAANFAAGVEKSGEGDAGGSGWRGGFFGDMPWALRLSDRSKAAYRPREGSFSVQSRQDRNGFRCVRTAPTEPGENP
jgi:hypothetical protein